MSKVEVSLLKAEIKIINGGKMKKRILLALSFVFAANVGAFAAEAAAAAAPAAQAAGNALFFAGVEIAAVLGLAIAAAGCGIGQGNAIARAMEGIARQPEASGKIQTSLLIGIAFIESLVLYVLVIGLILIFANPFLQYIVTK
jgi:F-type H+-transporting ATPase subunit c